MSQTEFIINGFPATPEQNGIILSIINGAKSVLVNAFAGTGKTTTLLGVAQAFSIRTRILYVVFTATMGADAKGRFPKNVEVKTVNAFAKRFAMGDRVLRSNNYSATEIRKLYNLEYKDAVSLLREFEYYCNSSKLSVPLHWNYAEYVMDMFENMESGDMAATHSWYLKKFHLMLEKDGKPYNMEDYDIIMMDEYQDTNGVTKSIVELLLPKQLIKVGDYNQGIFGFRGAENTMKDDIKKGKDEIHYLTSSFRYNQKIADGATAILQTLLGEPKRITGLGKKTTTHTACYISRTNATLITGIDYYATLGKKYRTLRDPTLIFGLPIAISMISEGKESDIQPHFKYLLWEQKNCRGNFIEHCKEIGEINKDMELYTAAKIASEYPLSRLQFLFETSMDYFNSKEYVAYFFGTAHSVKGLEFDHVHLMDDFKDYISLIAKSLLENESGISMGCLPAFIRDVKNEEADYSVVEEINLFYVAYTRALVSVILPASLQYFIDTSPQDIDNEIRKKYLELKKNYK